MFSCVSGIAVYIYVVLLVGDRGGFPFWRVVAFGVHVPGARAVHFAFVCKSCRASAGKFGVGFDECGGNTHNMQWCASTISMGME